MNIFAVDYCSGKCASALDDKRLNKMITETGQMLSINYGLLALGDMQGLQSENVDAYEAFIKKYELVRLMPNAGIKENLHIFNAIANHPCTQWGRANSANRIWLRKYFSDMLDEWLRRKGRDHAGVRFLPGIVYCDGLLKKESRVLSAFPRCFGKIKELNSILDIAPTLDAYRYYLAYQWDRSVTLWSNSQSPVWYEKGLTL